MTPSIAPEIPHPFLLSLTTRPSAAMVRGEGSWLWDEAGTRYLDFVQGWAVNALGHCPPEVQRALAQQSATLLTPSPAFHNTPQLALARRLAELSGQDQVLFANSGTEANEIALKLARKYGRVHKHGAYKVVCTWGAFHGRTFAMMAATGKPHFHQLFPPNVPGFVHVPFGDPEAVANAIDDATVAVMVEPIQGEAGVVVPPAGYLRALSEITQRAGVLLICDEIQTGIGRTGKLFAHEWDGIRPDIVTLGKGLGSGVPLSAVLTTRAKNCFEPGDHGSTYGGNPLCTAVGLAVLDTVADEAFLATVRERGAQLERVLREFAASYGGAVRGRGLFWGWVLPEDQAKDIARRCYELGLLVNAAQANVLRFTPSLLVSSDELDELRQRLGAALAA